MKELNLTVPTAWDQLTQAQLRQALDLLARPDATIDQAKGTLFLSWAGVTVIRRLTPAADAFLCAHDGTRFTLTPSQLASAAAHLDFLARPEDISVRLDETLQGRRAAHPHLHGFPFRSFILADRAYSLYVSTRRTEHAARLAALLYAAPPTPDGQDPEPPSFTPGELMGAVLWFAYVKAQFAARWSHLFRRPAADLAAAAFSPQAHQDQADAMIRALTAADITREPAVLQADCWRALTELNAKAREAAELRRLHR